MALAVVALLALAAFVVLFATGCGSSPTEPLQELPRELSAGERALVASGNEFGLDLFGRLAADSPEGNVVLSPLSAYLALGMTANGASSETLAGFREALHQSALTEEEANEAFRDLMALLLGLDDDVTLGLANSVWIREAFPVRQAFLELVRTYFDARAESLDFDDPGTVEVINAWVEAETRGKITDLIQTIEPEDVMFLINALYFQGLWQEPFDPDETRTADFRRLDGGTVDVPLMSRRGEVRHFRAAEAAGPGEGVEGVELLYGRGAWSMVVLLPPEGRTPAELAAELDPATWSDWVDGAREADMVVQIPRFRLEWERALNEPLAAMGMDEAFDPNRSDFSRLVEESAAIPGEDLYVSLVKQKTFIEVDEEGTEAAAATSVTVGVVSMPPTFRVDRPFLFAIRERFSGTILFIGQVTDPTAG